MERIFLGDIDAGGLGHELLFNPTASHVSIFCNHVNGHIMCGDTIRVASSDGIEDVACPTIIGRVVCISPKRPQSGVHPFVDNHLDNELTDDNELVLFLQVQI